MFIKPPHDQQIFFKSGHQRWVRDVIHIEKGEWTHMMTMSGIEYITNSNEIEFIRVYDNDKERAYGEQSFTRPE